MKNIHLADQCKIAAEILATGAPWQARFSSSTEWDTKHERANPITVLASDAEIRIKPTPNLIPLEASDIPPGSVFRRANSEQWICIETVRDEGIYHRDVGSGVTFTYYTSLHQAYYQINRSIPLLGKWDPTAWEPCSKPSQNPG